jgi:hypothetical protein
MDGINITPSEKKQISALKQAARNMNHPDCVRGGQELLRKAKEAHFKRKENGKKDTYQAAKEAATYLVGQARGRIRVTAGYTYSCFDCLNRLSEEKVEGKSICFMCTNGSFFVKKGDN